MNELNMIESFDIQDKIFTIRGLQVILVGASLKDLGKKWFAFSKMNINSFEIIGKLDRNKNASSRV